MINKIFNLPKIPGIISQPKAELILKSYGLSTLKTKIYGDIEQEETDQFDNVSKFGTPIFDNIIFIAPDYFIKTPKEDLQFYENFGDPNFSAASVLNTPVNLSGNTLIGSDGTQISKQERNGDVDFGGDNAFIINTALIEISQSKNIIITPVSGSSGTIKEYIGDGDYVIKIRGFVESNSPYTYPTKEVGILSSYLKAPIAIKTLSNYLRSFGIDSLVITDYSFPQTEGRRNLQFFEFTAVSDKELEAGFIKELQ